MFKSIFCSRLSMFLCCLLFGGISTWSQVTNLTTVDSFYQDTIAFTITNTGNNPTSFEYIIIQDNVLELTQGDTVIAPNGSVMVFGLQNPGYDPLFHIDLEEVSESRSKLNDYQYDDSKIRKKQSTLQVYPNPNDGRFTITWPQVTLKQFTLSIYNAVGQNVLSSTIRQADCSNKRCFNSIENHNWPSGFYWVVIESNQEIHYRTSFYLY